MAASACSRRGIEPALRQRQPVEREIVKDDGLAIGGDLDVAFDGIGMIDRRRGGGKGIFEDGLGRVVQAAVGDGAGGEPGGRRDRHHATSKIASTSTAQSSGNSATPTVVRACRPLSPSTSTIRSEAPFITAGSAAKSGMQLI